MVRTDLAAATQWITAATARHGEALPAHVMERLGVSRSAATRLLRKLEAAQWLQRDGTPRRPLFRPGPLKQVVQRYTLAGLQEDLPWSRDFAPFFEFRPEVSRMVQHAFAELLNNAIDHSGGESVTVSMRQTAMHVQLLVSDDGCGVFEHIQQAFDIDDPTLAMLELSKGKLTSQPDRHLGHGLYFTARLADIFDLHANASAFQYRGSERRNWHAGKPLPRRGTSIFWALALDTPRTLDAVLRSHSVDGAGYAFDRTTVPLRLMVGPHHGLASRAQAKRVVSRLQAFRHAEVDFSGIDEIGHGFADELFRVHSQLHPGLELVPVGMAPRVAALVNAIRSSAG